MYFISCILFVKTSLAGKIGSHLSTYCRGIQNTTSNDSCDMLNSKQLDQFFTCPSVFHENITHPSNYRQACSVKRLPNIS